MSFFAACEGPDIWAIFQEAEASCSLRNCRSATAVLSQSRATAGAEARALSIGSSATSAGHQSAGLRGRRHVGRAIPGLAPRRRWNSQHGGNPGGLDGVEFPHTAGHEEALDKAEKPRKPGPEEEAINNPQPRAPQIEMVRSETAQEERQHDAHDLIAAHHLITQIKNRLRVWIRLAAHGLLSLFALDYHTQPGDAVFPARWKRIAIRAGIPVKLCSLARRRKKRKMPARKAAKEGARGKRGKKVHLQR